MCINCLLTGLQPNISFVVCATNPPNLATASNIIKREMQLQHFKSQKQKPHSSQPRNFHQQFSKIIQFYYSYNSNNNFQGPLFQQNIRKPSRSNFQIPNNPVSNNNNNYSNQQNRTFHHKPSQQFQRAITQPIAHIMYQPNYH